MPKPLLDFKVDLKELDVLQRNFQFKSPSSFAFAVKQTLNDQAFAVQKVAKNNILPRKFNIRNNFVLASILVDKVPKGIKNPNLMLAEVGAAKKWRMNSGRPFKGMRLQEFGGQTRDHRIYSLESRGGSFAGLPKRKFWGKGNVEKDTSFPGSGDGRVIAMLRILDRRKYTGMMYITSHSKFKKGVYVFGKGKFRSQTRRGKSYQNVRMVKDLSKNIINVKPTYWLRTSVQQAVTQGTTSRFFRRAADKHLAWMKQRGIA